MFSAAPYNAPHTRSNRVGLLSVAKSVSTTLGSSATSILHRFSPRSIRQPFATALQPSAARYRSAPHPRSNRFLGLLPWTGFSALEVVLLLRVYSKRSDHRTYLQGSLLTRSSHCYPLRGRGRYDRHTELRARG